MLNLGSLHKDTIGFIFVRGVFFYFLYMKISHTPPITERISVLIFSLFLHFFYTFEVFLRIELGQQVFCQKQREPLVRK